VEVGVFRLPGAEGPADGGGRKYVGVRPLERTKSPTPKTGCQEVRCDNDSLRLGCEVDYNCQHGDAN
jgi:hypothetical protein